MKKIISIIMLLVITLLVAIPVVNAATNASLANELYAIGEKYGMTAQDKKKVSNYLTNFPVTDDEANSILSKANEMESVMKKSGKTNISALSKAQKNELLSLATEAANIAGATIVIGTDSITIKDPNGNVFDEIQKDRVLGHTDSNANIILITSLVLVVIALTTVIIAKRKRVNA